MDQVGNPTAQHSPREEGFDPDARSGDFFNEQDILPADNQIRESVPNPIIQQSAFGIGGQTRPDLDASQQQLLPGQPDGILKRNLPNAQSQALPPGRGMLTKPSDGPMMATIPEQPSQFGNTTTALKKQKKKRSGQKRKQITSGPKPLNPDLTAEQKRHYASMHQDQIANEVENLQEINKHAMRRLIGTETMIEKVLALPEMDTDPWDDLGNWPADANVYKGMKLSETMMIAAVDDREPRIPTGNGNSINLSLLAHHTGMHSSDRGSRKSDIFELGEGNMLYFKFLKYWMILFVVLTVLSLPAICLYSDQYAYNSITTSTAGLATETFGNLGYYWDTACSSAKLPDTGNMASHISFECIDGKKLTALQHFGLAFQNQTCIGEDYKKSVVTVDRCTMGSMTNEDTYGALQEVFESRCKGNHICSMELVYKDIFSQECIDEIISRNADNIDYGPAKAYAIAQCSQDTLTMMGDDTEYTIDYASMMVVVLDVLMMWFLSIMIIKLRHYEKLSVQDMKQGKTSIEDFSVSIPEIPIERAEYHNNPDLLTAMLATHFEEICANELQCIPELEEIQQNNTHVMSVHYGISSQTSMAYLVDIFADCHKIADLKKKIQVDPAGTREYENDIWRIYTHISDLNDAYYQDKLSADPEVIDAHITFQSMEGRARAVQAYDINVFQRAFVQFCCCLDNFFKKKKLMRQGYLDVVEAIDPYIINWEYVGITTWQVTKLNIIATVLILLMLIISFVGHWYLSQLQKDFSNLKRSDCSAEAYYDVDQAWMDVKFTDQKNQQGLLHCYCNQMYDIYGMDALKILFPDGEQYCKDWYSIFFQTRFITLAVGLWIGLTNFFITLLCILVGKYKYGNDTSDQHEFTTWNIALSHYLNTALIVMLAQNCFVFSVDTIEEALYNRSYFMVGIYDEFNSKWFLNIGSALLITQAFMLVLPHIFVILEAIGVCVERCLDRRCTFDTKNTSKIIQSDYEDLYTGPYEVLEVRYGQVMATIFVTLTFCSGIPLLLPLTFGILFVQYWVDKFLVFQYYRKTTYFTKKLSAFVVSMMPIAIIFHYVFAGMLFSNPFMFKSEPIEWFGNDWSQYFNNKRMGQRHMVVWFVFALLNALLFIFEEFFVELWDFVVNGGIVRCAQFCAKCRGLEYDEVDHNAQGFVLADDILMEISFGQLYKRYKACGLNLTRYKQQMNKGVYEPIEVKLYIEPYIKILERNYKNLRASVLEQVKAHEDVLADMYEVEQMFDEQKINALFEIYSKAADKENAERGEYKSMLDDSMFGGMMNEIQSYDYLDNEKYTRIQKLLKIMQETFGYDDFVGDGYKASMQASKPEGDITQGEISNRGQSRETGMRPDQDMELAKMGESEIQLMPGNSTIGGSVMGMSKGNLQ